VGVQFFAIGLLGEILVHNSHDENEYVIKEKNKQSSTEIVFCATIFDNPGDNK